MRAAPRIQNVACGRCGESFEAKRNDAKWCPACRPLVIREHNNGRVQSRLPAPIRSIVCRGCGATFEAHRSDAKWCAKCRTTGKDGRAVRFETMRRHPCPECGLPCVRKAVRCRKCSNRIRNANALMDKNPNWKGGRSVTADGYIEVRVASGNDRGSRILEHRYVWQQAHGPIPSSVHIHHANGDKADNRLENLVATDAKGHRHRNRMVDPYAEKVQILEARIRELEAQLE